MKIPKKLFDVEKINNRYYMVFTKESFEKLFDLYLIEEEWNVLCCLEEIILKYNKKQARQIFYEVEDFIHLKENLQNDIDPELLYYGRLNDELKYKEYSRNDIENLMDTKQGEYINIMRTIFFSNKDDSTFYDDLCLIPYNPRKEKTENLYFLLN